MGRAYGVRVVGSVGGDKGSVRERGNGLERRFGLFDSDRPRRIVDAKMPYTAGADHRARIQPGTLVAGGPSRRYRQDLVPGSLARRPPPLLRDPDVNRERRDYPARILGSSPDTAQAVA